MYMIYVENVAAAVPVGLGLGEFAFVHRVRTPEVQLLVVGLRNESGTHVSRFANVRME